MLLIISVNMDTGNCIDQTLYMFNFESFGIMKTALPLAM